VAECCVEMSDAFMHLSNCVIHCLVNVLGKSVLNSLEFTWHDAFLVWIYLPRKDFER